MLSGGEMKEAFSGNFGPKQLPRIKLSDSGS